MIENQHREDRVAAIPTSLQFLQFLLSCLGIFPHRSFLMNFHYTFKCKMTAHGPGVKKIMRSTWSWACRPRDRCPHSVTYTPGYPAVEEGPSLPGGLPRRPPVVPDGNNHRAHSSAGNQMSCHATSCAYFLLLRARERLFIVVFLSLNEERSTDRSMILLAQDDTENLVVTLVTFTDRSSSTGHRRFINHPC